MSFLSFSEHHDRRSVLLKGGQFAAFFLSSTPIFAASPEATLGGGQNSSSVDRMSYPQSYHLRLAYAARLETKGASTKFSILQQNSPLTTDSPPILRAVEGQAFEIIIENNLDFACAFHLRGYRGSPICDGVVGLNNNKALMPGEKRTLPIPAQQSGTFILAPILPPKHVNLQANGLYAIVVIEEKQKQPFDAEYVLSLTDWRLKADGSFDNDDFMKEEDVASSGRLGHVLMANHQAVPQQLTYPAGTRLRLRLTNNANARLLPLTIKNMQAEVIAIDSTPCTPFDPLRHTIILVPGSRVDMAITLTPEVGQTAIVLAKPRSKMEDGVPLVAITTTAPLAPAAPAPSSFALPPHPLPAGLSLDRALRANFVITKQETIREGAKNTVYAINDKVFAGNNAPPGLPNAPLIRVKKGSTLVLALQNKTDIPQVIGVHGHVFRLLHRLDDGWEPWFLDSLYLAPQSRDHIALLAEHVGQWAIRAVIAEHFAAGVAAWFEVY